MDWVGKECEVLGRMSLTEQTAKKHDLCSSFKVLEQVFLLDENFHRKTFMELGSPESFVALHSYCTSTYTNFFCVHNHATVWTSDFLFYNFQYRELRDSIVILAGMLGTYLNVLVCMPSCLYVYALMLYLLKLVTRWSVVLISGHQTCRIYLLKCLSSFITCFIWFNFGYIILCLLLNHFYL